MKTGVHVTQHAEIMSRGSGINLSETRFSLNMYCDNW